MYDEFLAWLNGWAIYIRWWPMEFLRSYQSESFQNTIVILSNAWNIACRMIPVWLAYVIGMWLVNWIDSWSDTNEIQERD